MNKPYPAILEEDIAAIAACPLDWPRFEGKTITVLGASGMLPGYIVDTLVRLKHFHNINCEVIGVVRSKDRALQRFRRPDGGNPLKFVEAVLGSDAALDIPASDFLIHAASNASPKFHQAAAIETLTTNFGGLAVALRHAAVNKNCKALFFSSAEVYGRSPNPDHPAIGESNYRPLDPLSARNAYAIGKLATESLAAAYCREQGSHIAIVRPFHCYGPGMKLDDGRVFADFVSAAATSSELVIHSDGSPIRAYCYIADATTAFLTVLLKGKPAEAYNVGNPTQCFSVRGLADVIQAIEPRCTIRFSDFERNLDGAVTRSADSYIPDITKLSSLGWTPTVSAYDGFKRTIAYYRELLGTTAV